MMLMLVWCSLTHGTSNIKLTYKIYSSKDNTISGDLLEFGKSRFLIG